MENRSRAALLSLVLHSVLKLFCLYSAHARWPASSVASDSPASWNQFSQVSLFLRKIVVLS